MTTEPIEVVRHEVISLVSESAEESQKGEAQSALSLLLEAQFLLGELIQNQLNTIHCAFPLRPPTDEFAEESDEGLSTAASSGSSLH
jgi:hypothetical protein